MIDTNLELSPSASAKLDLLQAILTDLAMELCDDHDLESVKISVRITSY